MFLEIRHHYHRNGWIAKWILSINQVKMIQQPNGMVINRVKMQAHYHRNDGPWIRSTWYWVTHTHTHTQSTGMIWMNWFMEPKTKYVTLSSCLLFKSGPFKSWSSHYSQVKSINCLTNGRVNEECCECSNNFFKLIENEWMDGWDDEKEAEQNKNKNTRRLHCVKSTKHQVVKL